MKSIGLARLGRDAELRYTPGGDAVCNLSIAYVCGQKKQGDQYAPSQWVDATLWGKQAEALAPYLVKGSVHCFCLSDVRLEEYEGRNGKGVKMVARVDNVELGPRMDGHGGNDQGSAPAPARQSGGGGPATPRNASAPRPAPNFSDMDDDIPF